MKKVIAVIIALVITTVGVMAARNSKKVVNKPEPVQVNFVSQNKSDVGTWD